MDDLNPLNPLTEDDFQLIEGAKRAFLLWDDATADIKNAYGANGVHPGIVDLEAQRRRIVRVVRLPAGTRLFKVADYRLEQPLRPNLSEWWSRCTKNAENRNGALELLRTAELNRIPFRDLIRFISAVSLDWNKLDWYLEIVLARPIYAFWGQFAPQSSIQSAPKPGMSLSMQHGTLSGWSTFVDHGDGNNVYVPDMLGGFGAWQLYIPKFDSNLIDQTRMVTLSATDNRALMSYLRRFRP